MAIRTPSVDYSTVAQAIQRENYINQMGLQNRMAGLQSDSLDIGQQKVDLMNRQVDYRIAKGMVDVAVAVASGGISLIQGAQLETAKTDMVSKSAQFDEMVTESILNGGTNVIQDADGKWDVQVDSTLTSWYQNELKLIDESNDTKAVKQWRTQALNSIYENKNSQILAGVLKKSQETIASSSALNVSSAMKSDVQVSMPNERSYQNGIDYFKSRTDLSPAEKDLQIELYMKGVNEEVEKKTISTLAATVGMSSATQYATSLLDKGYTTDQVNSYIASAQKLESSLSSSEREQVSAVMSQGLATGKSSTELWAVIEKSVDKLPEDRKREAIEAASQTQAVMVAQKMNAIYVSDADATVEDLKNRRANIKDGSLAYTMFYNLPELQDTYLSMYDKMIAARESAVGSASSDLVKLNKVAVDSTLAQFKNGDISGNDAMSFFLTVGANTEGIDDDTYALEALEKLKKDVVPEKYKDAADGMIRQMKSLNWGLGNKKNFTAEDYAKMQESATWAYGRIADIFMSTPGNNVSLSEFSEQLANISRVYTSDMLDSMSAANIRSGKATEDMLDLQQSLGSVNPVYLDDSSGQIMWASDEYRQAFDKVAGQFGNELADKGVTVSGAPHPLNMDGELLAVPQFIGTESDGVRRLYTINRDQILSSEDDGKTWQNRWTLDGTKLGKTKFNSSEPKVEYNDTNIDIASRTTGEAPEGTGEKKRKPPYIVQDAPSTVPVTKEDERMVLESGTQSADAEPNRPEAQQDNP
ncbi:MAG: hypothetical protein JXK93_13495, partial [Sphaerochaetaceae bacterium]|nr:hypothetical protein [Sphaerochaetaceae bacterium]